MLCVKIPCNLQTKGVGSFLHKDSGSHTHTLLSTINKIKKGKKQCKNPRKSTYEFLGTPCGKKMSKSRIRKVYIAKTKESPYKNSWCNLKYKKILVKSQYQKGKKSV